MAEKYLVLRKTYHNGHLFRAGRIVEGSQLVDPIPRHFLKLNSQKPPEVAIEEAKAKLAKEEREWKAAGGEGLYNPNLKPKSKAAPKAEKTPEK